MPSDSCCSSKSERSFISVLSLVIPFTNIPYIMYISSALVSLLAIANTAQAFQVSEVTAFIRDLNIASPSAIKRSISDALRPRAFCPSVWSNISKKLTSDFLSGGQCNDNARAAIRAAFHDCFNGGCDGSLILADECSRPENNGLQSICSSLGDMAKSNDVGVADLIQFAAGIFHSVFICRFNLGLMPLSAHAIKTCPLGPTVPAYVGRKDSSSASPDGGLPSPFASGDDLYSQFKAKGFSATDLAALIGAHSTSKQFFVDTSKSGAAQDSTPGTWDVTYYSQTLSGTAPFTFKSDANLAKHDVVGKPFKSFVLNQAGWNAAFVSA